jgi:hypothetical protein
VKTRLATSFRVTPQRLTLLLILACLIGIYLSLFTVLSKHYIFGSSTFRYYGGYAAFNVLMLILLIRRRKWIEQGLSACVDWLHEPTDVYARRVVFSTAVVIVLCYLTRAYIGFWFPGIAGWTEARTGSRMVETLPELSPEYSETTEQELAKLNGTIISDHARYLSHAGYIRGNAMLLHYKDGQSLPGNHELTNFVFPQYVFGTMYGAQRNSGVLAQSIKSTLEHRTQGRRFLLPDSVAYPNHSPYMPIDYRGYPPASELERVSLWQIVVFADPHGETKVVAAKREAIVNVLR